ncbi:sugar ABC transporter permease [Gottschalkiaceae bacterium SANA]|nr:sugar ABC transporter permease [Gottschalkiaceae bacterium SANA]
MDKKQKNLNTLTNLMKGNIRQYGMFIALFVIMVIFNILTKGTFVSARNLTNLYLQTGYIAVLATGMVLVIIAGHIDLSVGSIAAFTGAIAAILQVKMGLPTIPTVLITLLVGALIGCWQGFWIAYRKVPAFIVTLASMLMFRGAVIAITKGQTIGPFSDSFNRMSVGYLPDIANFEGIHLLSLLIGVVGIVIYAVMEFNKREKRRGYGFEVLPIQFFIGKLILVSGLILAFILSMALYKGIPYTVIIVVLLIGLYTFITTKTPLGRHVYAIGGNLEAARLSGISARKTLFKVFVSMGTLAALSGMIYSARLNSAAPSAGNLFELDAIAASFIGGASASGGVGTVFGAIIGALVMASINNGMSLLNLDISYQYLIKGLVLLLAVWFDISTRNKNK